MKLVADAGPQVAKNELGWVQIGAVFGKQSNFGTEVIKTPIFVNLGIITDQHEARLFIVRI